jgi:hypothetical protein
MRTSRERREREIRKEGRKERRERERKKERKNRLGTVEQVCSGNAWCDTGWRAMKKVLAPEDPLCSLQGRVHTDSSSGKRPPS